MNFYMPLAARRRRLSGAGGGAPVAPFQLKTGNMTKSLFGSRGGVLEVEGGVGPYFMSEVSGIGISGQPRADGVFPWSGANGGPATIFVRLSDSAGSAFILALPYGTMPNDTTRPVTVADLVTIPAPLDGTNPASLPIPGAAGASGLLAYTRLEQTTGSGIWWNGYEYRTGSDFFHTVFRSADPAGGLSLLPATNGDRWFVNQFTGPDQLTFINGLGVVTVINVNMPAGMANGERRPPAVVPPVNLTPPVLAFQDAFNLLYTAGTWSGSPAPTVLRVLNTNGPAFDIPVSPGVIPIDPAWRTFTASIQEQASNDGGASTITANSNFLPIPALTLDQQVEQILAGTTGFALDPRDFSTMFQDAAGTVPVTADGQPVGRINGKWGTTSPAYSIGTAAWRPVANVGGLLFDGVDDYLEAGVTTILPSGANAAFLCQRLAQTIARLHWTMGSSLTTPTQTRFGVSISPAGETTIAIRRPDGTGITRTFTTPTLPPNVAKTLSAQADVAGANDGNIWVDGVAGTPQSWGGAAAPFDATGSARQRIGASIANSPGATVFSGKLGRMVYCGFVPTPEQRAVLEAWVSAGPFDPPAPPPPAAEQWVLPTDFTSLPPNDGVVAHNGQNWKNIIASGNLGEPGIFYGWEAEP